MDEDAGLDWFGEPLPPSQGGARLAVPCPFCSELFQEGPALEGHLNAAHDYQVSRRTSPLDRLPPWMRSLGFLPLWFVLPMTAGLVALVYPHRARVRYVARGVRRGTDHPSPRTRPLPPHIQPPRLKSCLRCAG